MDGLTRISGLAHAGTAILLVTLIAFSTGGLGSPFAPDEVPFETVRREHFDALTVDHVSGGATDAPLVLRVQLLGDPGEKALEKTQTWLARHVNVELVEDPRGAPLFLTEKDLSATSGRATLGATLRTGMAVEVSNPEVAPCVLTHEVLHFLGLHHVQDSANIMAPHCKPGMLETATIEDWQVQHVRSLHEIRAATPRGPVTWASR